MSKKHSESDKQLLERFEALQTKAGRLKTERDRADGQLMAIMDRIKTDFGAPSIKAAKKLLTKLERDARQARDQLQTAIKQFEDEFHDDDGEDH